MTVKSRFWTWTFKDSGLVRRGTATAENSQETPTKIHISPSILVYEDTGVPSSLESGPDAADVYPKAAYRGASLMRNIPPPWGRHRALGLVLL